MDKKSLAAIIVAKIIETTAWPPRRSRCVDMMPTPLRAAHFIFQTSKKSQQSLFFAIHTVWAFISRHAGTSNTHAASPTCCCTCRQEHHMLQKYSIQSIRITLYSMRVLLSMCAHGSTIASPTFYGKQK